MLRRLLTQIDGNTLYLMLGVLYWLAAVLAGCGAWGGLVLWLEWPHWAGLIAGVLVMLALDRLSKAIVDEMVRRSEP